MRPIPTDWEVKNNILETIGNTPLVRLNRVTAGIEATVLAKLESFNPGGSVKDRIGLQMIEDFEAPRHAEAGRHGRRVHLGQHRRRPRAWPARCKGYRSTFTMPDKMSQEKIRLLKAYGARVIVTPTAVAPESPESYYSVARQIVAGDPELGAHQPVRQPGESRCRTTRPPGPRSGARRAVASTIFVAAWAPAAPSAAPGGT